MAAPSNGSSRDPASSFLAGLNLPPADRPIGSSRDSRDRRHDDRYEERAPRDSYRDHRRDGQRSDRGREGDRYGDRYDRDRRDRDRGDRDRYKERDAHRDRRDDRSGRPRDDRNADRGGGGGGGGGGGAVSKPKGPREAIPEGIEPILKRRRKASMWDVKPVGYPNMTPGQAKLSGMFPLPGQPRPVGQASLMRGLLDGVGGGVPGSNNQARQARRLYVGSIPEDTKDQALLDFFNKAMTDQKLTTSSEPAAIDVQLGSDGTYAFVEFNSPEEATAAMAFDGMTFRGQTLKIRRPKDYVEMPPDEVAYGVHIPGVISTNVPDTPNKIFIGGLPIHLNEEQVMELLKAFGELRAFNLVKDTAGASKGFAFCEYVDHTLTDVACENLNNMELLDKRLIVQRASVGGRGGPVSSAGSAGLPIPLALLTGDSEEAEPTRVMQLLNLMSLEELQDPMDHSEICEDVRVECEKFGEVLDMKAPRPQAAKIIHGVGKVYVRFGTKESCTAAIKALGGRQFDMRTVITSYFKEEAYENDQFEALHV